MVKLALAASIATVIGALTFANMSEPFAADPPCVAKTFKTKLVEKACKEGGQKKAKEVMKAWNKSKKIKSCNQCHTKLAPKYELKADGLEQYKKLGGE